MDPRLYSKTASDAVLLHAPSPKPCISLLLCVWVCVRECSACMYVCAVVLVPDTGKGQKKVSDPLELELESVVRCYMVARNWTSASETSAIFLKWSHSIALAGLEICRPGAGLSSNGIKSMYHHTWGIIIIIIIILADLLIKSRALYMLVSDLPLSYVPSFSSMIF